MRIRNSFSLALLAATLVWGALAQAPPKRVPHVRAPQLGDNVGKLRHEYYAQDYFLVAQDGQAMLAQHPKDLELRAWYVVGANSDFQVQNDGVDAVVAGMKKSAPKSPWTLLASAATDSDLKSEIDLCEQAIAADKSNFDVLALATDMVQRTSLRQSVGQHPPNADALKKFLAEYKDQYKQSPHALASEAQALGTVAQIEKDTKSTAAIDLADQVLKADPNNVVALLAKARALQAKQKYEDAYHLLRTAAVAVPDSYALHQDYWHAAAGLPNANPEEKRKEIIADAIGLMSRVKPPTPAVEMILGDLGETTSGLVEPIGDALLKKYPNSNVEDVVLFQRAVKSLPLASGEQNIAHRATALEAFLDRPRHYDNSIVQGANTILMLTLTVQKNPDLDRLYNAAIASGVVDPAAITVLADHKSHLSQIHNLVSEKLNDQWTALQNSLEGAPESQIKNRVTNITTRAGTLMGTLGWTEFNEGNSDAALANLQAASKLNSTDLPIAVHLGKVYEARDDNAKAEKSFEDALSMPYYGGGDHPAVTALRELYIKTHGSQAGLDAYMTPFLAKDAARRKKIVLATRLNPEKPIIPFTLASLDGKEVSSKELKGKLLVINYWATW